MYTIKKKKVSRATYYRWLKATTEALQHLDDSNGDESIASLMSDDENFDAEEDGNFMVDVEENSMLDEDDYNNVGINSISSG